MAHTAWGIDIGGSAIKIAKVARVKGAMQVQALEIFPLALDAGADQAQRNQEIKTQLEAIRQKCAFKRGEAVWVSLPGQAVFQRNISLFGAESANLRELVFLEAQQQIPSAIEEIVWDFHVNSSSVKPDEDTDITLYAVKRENLDYFLQWWSAAGIAIDGIQMAPLAVFNYLRADFGDETPRLVLDLGAENADLILAGARKATIRSITIAGHQMTRALEKKFKIPFAEAEKLKIEATNPQYERHAEKIYETVKPRLQELADEMHRSIGFFQSQGDAHKYETLYLTGLGTRLLGTKHFFKEKFSTYTIEKLDALHRLAAHESIDVTELKKNLGAFAVALGLAIQGADGAVNRINLIPPEIIASKAAKKRLPMLVGAMGVVLLALVGDWLLTSVAAEQAKRELQERQQFVTNTQRLYDEYLRARALDPVTHPLDSLAQVGDHRHVVPLVSAVLLEALDDFNQGGAGRAPQGQKDPLVLKLHKVEVNARPVNFLIRVTKPGKTAPSEIKAQLERNNAGMLTRGVLNNVVLRHDAPGGAGVAAPRIEITLANDPVTVQGPAFGAAPVVQIAIATNLSPTRNDFRQLALKTRSELIQAVGSACQAGAAKTDWDIVDRFGLDIEEHGQRQWDLTLGVSGLWRGPQFAAVQLADLEFWTKFREKLAAAQPEGRLAGLDIVRFEEAVVTAGLTLDDLTPLPESAKRPAQASTPSDYLTIVYRCTVRLKEAP